MTQDRQSVAPHPDHVYTGSTGRDRLCVSVARDKVGYYEADDFGHFNLGGALMEVAQDQFLLWACQDAGRAPLYRLEFSGPALQSPPTPKVTPTQAEFQVTQQGKPVLGAGGGRVVGMGENLLALEIDMQSKWCEVDATGTDGTSLLVCLAPTERSVHLDNTQESPLTEITFPGLRADEWDIFTAVCNRYTLRVVFLRTAKNI